MTWFKKVLRTIGSFGPFFSLCSHARLHGQHIRMMYDLEVAWQKAQIDKERKKQFNRRERKRK